MDYYYLDGEILSTKTGISPFDLSIHRSYAVFDYCIFREEVILFLEDYLERFKDSVKAMGIELPVTQKQLKDDCYGLIQRNNLKDGGLKLIMTGGPSPNAYSIVKPSLLIFCLPVPVYPEEFYISGLSLMSLEHVRQFSKVKTTNYFVSLSYQKALAEAKAEDFIYHYKDIVSESSRSNVFLVKDKVIKTADKDILFGITRKYALQLAEQNYGVQIGEFSLKDYYEADEVFLTSTTKLIMPVSRIDNKSYSYSDKSVCLQLLNEMKKLQAKYIESNKI